MEVERLESTESSGTLKQARVISIEMTHDGLSNARVKCLIIFQATRHIHPPSIRNKPLPQVSFTSPLTTLSTPIPLPHPALRKPTESNLASTNLATTLKEI
jgi:hypothetical protein